LSAMNGPSLNSFGQTVARSLSENQARQCSVYLGNFKKLKSIIEEMKKISIQMIEHKK
jgi:hypothetical protein